LHADSQEVYEAAFKRMCRLVGSENDNPADPLIRDFHETLAAYEQPLTEKNGRLTSASRTRQKIKNKGIRQSLIEWTRGRVETNGFKLLIEVGMPEYTGEYLVLRYADRFPRDVVQLSKARLLEHKVALPPSYADLDLAATVDP
jgi:hypothetical protein